MPIHSLIIILLDFKQLVIDKLVPGVERRHLLPLLIVPQLLHAQRGVLRADEAAPRGLTRTDHDHIALLVHFLFLLRGGEQVHRRGTALARLLLVLLAPASRTLDLRRAWVAEQFLARI